MLNTMLGMGDGAWSDVIDDLIVMRNFLWASIRKKMAALPNGGIIAVVNHVQVAEHETLAGIITDFLASEAFSDFGPYTLILHQRWNSLQFRSALFRRGEPVREQKSGFSNSGRLGYR